MRRKTYSMGSLWMIMLYIVLCLTIFTVLTLLAAKRNERLTDSTLRSIEKFYEADTRAKEILALIEGLYEEVTSMDELGSRIVDAVDEELDMTTERISNTEFVVKYSVPCGEQQLSIRVMLQDEEGVKKSSVLEWIIVPDLSQDYEAYTIEFGELYGGG